MRVWEIFVEIFPENSFYIFFGFIIIYILFYIFYLKNFSRTKNFFIFITWLYISFLLSISFLPLWIIPEKFSDFNITEKIIEYKIYSSFYVPLLHILVFIPLGFLFSYFNKNIGKNLIIGLSFIILIEIFQFIFTKTSFYYSYWIIKDFKILDILANSSGFFIWIIIWLFLFKFFRKYKISIKIKKN